MAAESQRQKERIEDLSNKLRITVGKIQEFDTLHSTQKYRGNEYNSYAAAVEEIKNKANGTADWGVALTGNLLSVMAAFTIGHGIGFTGKDAINELAFLKELWNYNDFDDEGLARVVIESEKEGKLLLELSYDKNYEWSYYDGEKEVSKVGMVRIRFKPWRTYGYTVQCDENDYLYYISVSWGDGGQVVNNSVAVQVGANTLTTIKAGKLDEKQFVYRKFGGSIEDPNTACPKIMLCLTEIDDYDKCKRDWRQINHLFASPTPSFELEDMKQVKEFNDTLEKMSWNIGKYIAHIGKFSMVSASLEGAQSIERERLSLQKTISGATGVPVHFYDPEVMSNKRLGENEMEFVWASFNTERLILISAMDELVRKAIEMHIEKSQAALDYRKIKSTIKVFTDGDWQRLRDIFMPMREKKQISRDAFLARIPGIDVEEEKKLQDAEQEVEDQKTDNEATKQLDMLKNKVNKGYEMPFNNPKNFNKGVEDNA